MSRAWVTWTLVAILSSIGCGDSGGGGDGGGDTCPPGTTLEVHPPTITLVAGSAGFDAVGGLSNCPAMVQWSLNGPGSISATSGIPIHYTPPATVASTATATLTASAVGLVDTIVVTITPASTRIAGLVIGGNGFRVAGATVRVGNLAAVSDATGAFALEGVSVPYEVTVTSPDGLLTTFYPELSRADPTLVLLDVQANPPHASGATGALSGGVGFPDPDGHRSAVAFGSPVASGENGVVPGAVTYSVGASWSEGAAVSGTLHALQWAGSTDSLPASYDGYAEKTGVTLTDQVRLDGQDLSLQPVGATALQGTIVSAPTGGGSYLRASLLFESGARMSLGAAAVPATFSLPMPRVTGVKVELVAKGWWAGDAWQEVHRSGLAPDATGVALEFVVMPWPTAPARGATVSAGTTFSWAGMPGDPVYVLSVRGNPGTPGYDVITKSQSITIPADMALPRGASFDWRVLATTAVHTIEEAAGPGGWITSAQDYVRVRSDNWQVVTAP